MISNYTFKYPVVTLTKKLKTLCAEAATPITFVCGEFSDLYINGMGCVSEVQAASSKVMVKVFKDSGHHVQVQKPFEVAWFILNSVLSTDGLPPLDPAHILKDMIEKGHCKPQQPLVTSAKLSQKRMTTSQYDILVFVIFVLPVVSVIFYLIFYFINFVLQGSSHF